MKTKELSFNDFSGGLNEIDHPSLIGDNQMANGSYNIMQTRRGLVRRKAYLADAGISARAVMGVKNIANTRTYMMSITAAKYLTAGTLVDHNISTDATVSNAKGIVEYEAGLFAFLSNSQFYWCDMLDANSKVYPVGMPVNATGGAIVEAAGGSIPAGDYDVKVTLAYKSSTFGIYRGTTATTVTVTLGSGDNTISVSAPTTTKQQATHYTIWIKRVGTDNVFYSYGDYTIGTAAVNLTDQTAKDLSTIYEVEIGNNVNPSTTYSKFSAITIHNKQLWFASEKTVRYSRKATTIADYLKFDDGAFIIYPDTIYSMFSLGEHLYLNTEVGLIRQPYGDPSYKYEYVDTNIFYISPLSILQYKNVVIGHTNKGIRIFDGNTFSANITENIDTYVVFTGVAPAGAPLSAMFGRGFYDNEDISYHFFWGTKHYMINLDSYLITGNALLTKIDLPAVLGFVDNLQNYLIQTQPNTGAPTVIRDDTTSPICSYDTNVLKGTSETPASSAVNFALYTKRQYMSSRSMMKLREVKVLGNKTTDEDTSSGITVNIKAFNL